MAAPLDVNENIVLYCLKALEMWKPKN